MTESNFYAELLGLEKPWEVESVTLDKANLQVRVKVRCKQTVWVCPETRQRVHIHEWTTRKWRHLDTCQFKTVIEADVPRLKYPDGRTANLDVPWAEDSSRFTSLFERLAIELMLCCSTKEAAGILGVSWDQADSIKSRAVKRGLARRKDVSLERICIDEKSYQRGHKYLTCVARIDEGKARVHHLEDGKGADSLDRFFEGLDRAQLASIQTACLDMSKAFLSSLKGNLPGWEGKVVHDRFHLVQHLNKAVNDTRKIEHAELSKQKDYRLKGTRQLWLYGEENLEVAMIYGRLGDFLGCGSRAEGAECFKLWHQWAIRSRLPAVEKVARMFKRHLAQILNYFDHQISNGPIEGLNSRIQGLIKKAYGYRNKERLKNDIYFHLGGLDLYPETESLP